MTLPDERYRAVRMAERFMQDLLDPSKTPRVPKSIRAQARSVLRHYPSSYDLDRAAQASPEIFTRHLDPLYKMVKQHDMRDRIAAEVEEDLREAKNTGLI